jgi:hypothetical protein
LCSLAFLVHRDLNVTGLCLCITSYAHCFFNGAQRYEGVLGEWMYSSTRSLTSALEEVSGQIHDPAALLQGNSPWYPLDRRLGGPQSLSGRGGEEKNSQPPPGIEP